MPPSSRGQGHLPFTEKTGIRIPLGVNKLSIFFVNYYDCVVFLNTIKNLVFMQKFFKSKNLTLKKNKFFCNLLLQKYCIVIY